MIYFLISIDCIPQVPQQLDADGGLNHFPLGKPALFFCLIVLCNGQNAFEHLLEMKLTSAQTAKTTTITTTFYWYNANLSYKNLVNAAKHKNKPQRNSYFYADIKKHRYVQM